MIKEQIVNNGHGGLSPSFLVVHSTANPGATAQNHASYWRTNDYAVHYVSDWNEALHTVPDNRKCWHVGNANGRSIGIEICEATNETDFKRGWEIAVQTCAEIMNNHGWGIGKLVTHDWCRINYGGTDHTDPNPYFERWGTSFDAFNEAVKAALGGGSVSAPNVSGGDSSTSTAVSNGSIADVQRWCNDNYNYSQTVDGIYGKNTKKGLVRALQTELNTQFSAKLCVDGIFGSKTKAACVNVRNGARGNITKALQGALICHGYGTNGFDGIFGSGTESAVRSFQADNGLSVDGIAGKNTFASLLG